MGNIIVIGIIILIFIFAIIKIKKDRQNGGCSSCPKGCNCSKKITENKI